MSECLVGNGRLRIKPSAIAVWCCFAVFEPTVYTALLFCVMALHEFGHLLALRLCKVKDVCMTLSAFGAEIRYHTAVSGTARRTMIALGGILMNLITAVLFLLWMQNPISLYVSVASFVLAFLNLMPVRGLDGGKALEEILLRCADFNTVYAVMKWSSWICVVLLGILSVGVLMASNFNFSLLLFTLYLSLSVFR